MNKLTKGNMVLYEGHQMIVVKVYTENGVQLVDLQGHHYKKYLHKIPAEDCFFLAKKQTKYM